VQARASEGSASYSDAVVNRYASRQQARFWPRTGVDIVVASGPITFLVAGLGLGAGGYALEQPAVAASGALAGAVGFSLERLQARALRRRRRAERLRSREEVTELRRTIAQLREEVDAFQRALLDTEAALAAGSLPLLVPVAEAQDLAASASEPAPASKPASAPAAQPHIGGVDAQEEEVVVVALTHAEASDWVQTPPRDAAGQVSLPARRPTPFIAAVGGWAPIPLPAASSDLGTRDADLADDDLADADLTDAVPVGQGRRIA
jgi:hypothetical protein